MFSYKKYITETNSSFNIQQFVSTHLSGTRTGSTTSAGSTKKLQHDEGAMAQFAAMAHTVSKLIQDSGHADIDDAAHEQIRKHVYDTLHAHFHPVTGQYRKNDFEFTVKTPQGTPRWSVKVGNPYRTDKALAGVNRDDIMIKSLDPDRPHEEYIDVKTDRANLADRTVSGTIGGRATHKDVPTSRFLSATGVLVTPGETRRATVGSTLKSMAIRRSERAKVKKGTTAFALVDIDPRTPHNSRIGFYKTSGDKQEKRLSNIGELETEAIVRSSKPKKSGKQVSQRLQLQLMPGAVRKVLSNPNTAGHTLQSLMQSKKSK